MILFVAFVAALVCAHAQKPLTPCTTVRHSNFPAGGACNVSRTTYSFYYFHANIFAFPITINVFSINDVVTWAPINASKNQSHLFNSWLSRTERGIGTLAVFFGNGVHYKLNPHIT